MVYDCSRTLACICPYCTTVSKRIITPFDFSGDEIVTANCLVHGCGEKCVAISQGAKKYKVEIECPVCAQTHTFLVPYNSMWTKNVMTFKCPESTIDVLFIGKEELVDKKIEESIEAYRQMIEDSENESEEIDLLYEIIERLEELSQNGNIKCVCGNHRIKPMLLPDGIEMVCDDCGRHAKIDIDEISLEKLLQTDEFTIS